MSDPELAIEGHSPLKPNSPNKPASPQTDHANSPKEAAENKVVGEKFTEETKKEVYNIAEKILAAAADKSSGETEKKLIAAVMAVHMKYAESLHVIENLIQDRKKIDDRVKFLEGQLNKRGKTKPEPAPKPPGNKGASSKRPARASSSSPKRKKEPVKSLNATLPARSNKDTAEPVEPDPTGPSGGDQDGPPDSDAPDGGDESCPEPEAGLRGPSPSGPHRSASPALGAGDDSDCEDELFVIKEEQDGDEGGLPPAYNSKMRRSKPVDPLRSRKAEIKSRLQELYEMPPDTRGATPKSCATVGEAFPARPRTAPGQAARDPSASDNGSDVGASRRPSTASLGGRRRKLSVKDEIESLEQELYEIEQKLRFKRASKVGPAEFSGMKERDAIMRKRAEDRLEKSRQRAEAAEKLRQEEEERQEQAKLRRIEQAKKSGNVDESGNPRAETWEERLEREKQEREERKLKHKAAILAQRVPLTASLEESITVFKDSKGKYAPEPPKIKVEPIKATDPEKVAARIARDAAKLEEARIKKEKANEERIRSLAVAPDHPAVVKMNERAVATKAKADQRAQEQQRKDEEARAAAQRAEQERLDAIKAQKAPDVKPTNAQISRDLEVKRAEEARIEEQKRRARAEEERVERQKELQRSINAAKKKDATTSRVVLGEGGEPLNSGGKQRPTLTERFDNYHKPHLHI